jgi:hypothetical protein
LLRSNASPFAQKKFPTRKYSTFGCVWIIANGLPSPSMRPLLPNDLASDIQQFIESDFAKQYFSTHREGFIFKRKVPIEQLMTWQKVHFSSSALFDRLIIFGFGRLHLPHRCFSSIEISTRKPLKSSAASSALWGIEMQSGQQCFAPNQVKPLFRHVQVMKVMVLILLVGLAWL